MLRWQPHLVSFYDRKLEERISTMAKENGEKFSIKKLRGKEDYNEWSKRMLLILDKDDTSDYIRGEKEKSILSI